MRVRLLLWVMFGMQSFLLGMLNVHTTDNKNVVWEMVAHHLPCDDYDMYRTYALINVACYRAVENTHRSQKKFIEKYIQDTEVEKPIPMTGVRSWNKNFNKCAWVTYDGDPAVSKDLQLTLIGADNGKVVPQTALWQKFYFPIFEDNVRPFFDKDGRACFDGYGITQACGSGGGSFAQYCIDLSGNMRRYCCYFEYRTSSNDFLSYHRKGLAALLQYPVLVKAFLQSKLVDTHDRCCLVHSDNDPQKWYDIQGVTLPEDYKKFKKIIGLGQLKRMIYRRDCSEVTSYDSLDSEVRRAIDYHYEKQQQAKYTLWNVIIAYCLAHGDYDTYRNVAMLSKTHNKITEDSHRPKKKLIENFMKWKTRNVTGYASWNKDFSKCAWVTIDSGKKILQLTLIGLFNDDIKRAMSSSRLWYDFHFPVFEDNIRPFFDKDGRACFYGFGVMELHNVNQNIIGEYSIDLDGKAECFPCQCVISNGYGLSAVKSFTPLLNFSGLLRALLQSKNKTLTFERRYHHNYYTGWATIPGDYKIYKKHVGLEKMEKSIGVDENSKYTSYELLPENLRQAIDERCEEQQREKNKKHIKM